MYFYTLKHVFLKFSVRSSEAGRRYLQEQR